MELPVIPLLIQIGREYGVIGVFVALGLIFFWLMAKWFGNQYTFMLRTVIANQKETASALNGSTEAIKNNTAALAAMNETIKEMSIENRLSFNRARA